MDLLPLQVSHLIIHLYYEIGYALQWIWAGQLEYINILNLKNIALRTLP